MSSILAPIGFTVGALSAGLWLVLGLFWIKRTRGVLRVALIWIAFNTVGTLAFRIFAQIDNYEAGAFPAIDGFRLFFNVSIFFLGLYLAKNSGKINREGDLSPHES